MFLPTTNGHVKLKSVSASNWGRDDSKQRSWSGFLSLINAVPVIWLSNVQTSTSQYTAEAEFVPLKRCVRKIVWVRGILHDIAKVQVSQTKIFQGNMGTVKWTEFFYRPLYGQKLRAEISLCPLHDRDFYSQDCLESVGRQTRRSAYQSAGSRFLSVSPSLLLNVVHEPLGPVIEGACCV